MGILKGIAVAGLVSVSLIAPPLGAEIAKAYLKSGRRSRKQIYDSIRYLDRRGYVKILQYQADGKVKIKITRQGKEAIKTLNVDTLQLKRPQTWDGKWRMIMFDVPVYGNKNRHFFTDKLRELGLFMVQKSVWIYPYECYEEIMLIRRFFEIERNVVYFEAINVEDDHLWRERFNLPRQRSW